MISVSIAENAHQTEQGGNYEVMSKYQRNLRGKQHERIVRQVGEKRIKRIKRK